MALLLTLGAVAGADELAPEAPPPTLPATEGSFVLDDFRDTVAHALGASSRWVDGFFGPQRFTDEAHRAQGRLSARVVWREYRGTRVSTKLRANLPLENLHHRFNAFLRKGQVNEIVQDSVQTPSMREGEGRDTWLLGLGYAPPWGGARQPFKLNAGLELDWPIEPFVRVSYRYERPVGDSVVLRVNPGVFWKRSEQFGATASLDFDWRLGEERLIRFPNWFKASGSTVELEYDSRAIWMQKLRGGQAIMAGLAVQGDTGARVPLRQYGAYVVLRRQLWRPWLAAEFIGGAGMLREDDWAKRKLSVGFGVGFEIAFEEKPGRATTFAGGMLRALHL